MIERMYDRLGRPLVVEVDHLLANSGVLQKIVATRSGMERIGGIRLNTITSSFDLVVGISTGSLELCKLLISASVPLLKNDEGTFEPVAF